MISRLSVVVLSHLLVLQPVFAQQQSGQRGLRIVVVDGAGSRNVVLQIAARPMTVRVEDAQNRPVAGAEVVFTAPQAGPGGEFANDSRTARVLTGPDGLASAGIYHPNATTGSYEIRVTAQFQGENATAVISQTNIGERKGHGKLFATLAIAGAAAGAAVAYRNRNTGSSPTNVPTITFGGAAVGAPK